jgi:hypothetical protein
MNALQKLVSLKTRFENHRAISYDEGWEIIDIIDNNIDDMVSELNAKESKIEQFEWKLISSAPFNTIVLLCNSNKEVFEDYVGVGWWQEINGRLRWLGYHSDPTHWMPLPPAPKQGQE